MPKLIATVALEITRDAMTILPRTVGAHELPILQAVFGRDNVQEVGPGEPVAIEPENEVARLVSKYGEGAVEKAFGQAFEREICKELAAHAVKSSDAGQGGAVDSGKALDEMTKDELLAEAKARGVSATAAMAKADILAAIVAAEG